MKNRVLAIDLGNTTISYALFQKSRIIVYEYTRNSDIPALIKSIRKRGVKQPFDVILTSVVPKKALKLKKALKRSFKEIKIWEVGKNVHPKVKMRYKRSNLGSDRLVNVYGALQRYRLPILVIDYGTAITFDFIDKKGIFSGGLIVPGIETSWAALQERAALLPKLPKLKLVNKLTPTETRSAMYSGVLNGFGALSEGLVSRYKKKYGRKMTVLATGGASVLIAPFISDISEFDIVDPLHTLKSLNLIFQKEILKNA